MPETPQKIINLEYLTALSKGNANFVHEMVTIFLTENPEEIKAFEKGINELNFDLIKTTAHKLKSTIPFVGLDKIINKEVEEVEALSSEKSDIDKIKTLFAKIKEVCERACYELQPV